jgi:glycosyltransferase involved in cell wall biosynthesis
MPAPAPSSLLPTPYSLLPALRLACLVSHPIQYQSPLFRRIAQEPGIDLTVLFGSDFSTRVFRDEGFGVDLQWDVPLLGGFRHEFLPTLRDTGTHTTVSPIARGLLSRLAGTRGQRKFDALWVHGYASALSMQGILAANFLGIPVLLRSDSTLRDRPRGPLKRAVKSAFFGLLKPLVAGILTAGTRNDAYWRKAFGEDTPRFLLPYAVDNDWFRERSLAAQSTRAALQAELNLDPARPVILFASKLEARKHCDDLIAAYARLSPAPGVDPHPYLLIVGDGDQRPALERQAAATGFGSIRLCGFRNQTELPRFFDLASVFVLPARHEPWGLIVNEVMNAARPVILSDDIGCAPDLVTDGIEGCIYPVRDVAALADCLRRVLASPATAEAMGRNALRRIESWSFEQDILGLRRALTHVTRKLPS